MTRTPSVRARVVVGLLISVVAHAAVFALVSIEIPEPASTRIALVRPVLPESADDPSKPPIQVIEIRAPGMQLPSGGGSEGSDATLRTKTADPGSAALSLATVAPAPRRLVSRGASEVSLAPQSPLSATPEIVLASSPAGAPDRAEDESATRVRRPGRGVVLRGGGSDGGSGATGTGTAGRGLGLGSGGVTIIGPGGDCITPGSSLPSGRAIPDERPKLGAGGRTSTGRIGRGGSGFRPR